VSMNVREILMLMTWPCLQNSLKRLSNFEKIILPIKSFLRKTKIKMRSRISVRNRKRMCFFSEKVKGTSHMNIPLC